MAAPLQLAFRGLLFECPLVELVALFPRLHSLFLQDASWISCTEATCQCRIKTFPSIQELTLCNVLSVAPDLDCGVCLVAKLPSVRNLKLIDVESPLAAIWPPSLGTTKLTTLTIVADIHLPILPPLAAIRTLRLYGLTLMHTEAASATISHYANSLQDLTLGVNGIRTSVLRLRLS